jgi:hypothetical protein
LMGRGGGVSEYSPNIDLDQIQNNGQPTVPFCSLDQTLLVKKYAQGKRQHQNKSC